MPPRPHSLRAAGIALWLALCALAYAPLVQTGFTGPDLRVLADAGSLAEAGGVVDFARRAHAVGGLEGEPLAALDLALWSRLYSSPAGWASRRAWPLRLENLLLLLASAVALGFFLRRLLLPWVGREAATAAGRAACLLLPLVPLQPASLVQLSARGTLLALCLGISACALLLRGRQEHRPALSVWTGVLVLGAAAASRLGLALPLLLAGAEFLSARRWRPERERWRTTFISLAAFGLCAALPRVLETALTGHLAPLAADSRLALAGSRAGLLQELTRELERLGVLFLPVHMPVLGLAGITLAATVLLLALHPALQAARAAPRLWGWMAAAWFAVLMLGEVLAPAQRVSLEDLSGAATLVAASTVTCAGLAVTATALSGWRRAGVPIALALAWTVLAHGGARAWRSAAEELGALREELEDARQTHGRDALLVVIDPSGRAMGVDALAGELAALCEPTTTGRASDARPPNVRGISSAGFLALARESEFDALRRAPLIVSLPRSAIGLAGLGRIALRLNAPAPSDRVHSWQVHGRSPALDLEALDEDVLRLRTQSDAETQQPPQVYWRAQSGHELLAEGSCRGVWFMRPPYAEEPIAIFDLSSELTWVLAGRVRQLYPREGWGSILEAEVLARLPEPAPDLAPRIEGGDWVFRAPPEGFPVDDEGRTSWYVQLLDLTDWRHTELEARELPDGDLHVAGAAAVVAEWLRSGGGPVAWTLEGRIAGTSAWRARGRRVTAR